MLPPRIPAGPLTPTTANAIERFLHELAPLLDGITSDGTIECYGQAVRVSPGVFADPLTVESSTSPEGLTDTGVWLSGSDYVVGDVVSDGGSHYRCVLYHTNHEPPNATYWALLPTSAVLTPTSVEAVNQLTFSGDWFTVSAGVDSEGVVEAIVEFTPNTTDSVVFYGMVTFNGTLLLPTTSSTTDRAIWIESGDLQFRSTTTKTAEVTAHKNTANGYAGLNSSGYVGNGIGGTGNDLSGGLGYIVQASTGDPLTSLTSIGGGDHIFMTLDNSGHPVARTMNTGDLPAGVGTVTAVSIATANGFSGSSSGGATPALTIVAGAITPTSVNGITLSGSSTPTLAVTGTTTVSGVNTGDQTTSGTANQVSVATGTANPVISLTGPHGFTTQTAHNLLIGAGTSAISSVSITHKGSLLAGQAAADPIELVVGSDGKVLTADSAASAGVSWQTAAISPLTTKGDVWGFSTVDARIPVGTNALPLVANSAVALGVNYAVLTVPGGGSGATTLTAHGVLLGEGTSAIVATAAMTDGQVLVGQTSADPLPKTMSGDATMAASGTITLKNTGTAGTYNSVTTDAQGRVTAGSMVFQPPQTRLTLTSGTPVTTGDVSSTTLYIEPYLGQWVSLWNGTGWVSVAVPPLTISLALGTMTSGLPYDVFAYLSSGALALEKLAWTNATTRATNISYQNGALCKVGDATRLFLGTFIADSTTTAADSLATRYLANMYCRVPKNVESTDSTSRSRTATSYAQVGSVQIAFVSLGDNFVRSEGEFCVQGGNGWVTIGSGTTTKATGAIDGIAGIGSSLVTNMCSLSEAPAVGLITRYLIFRSATGSNVTLDNSFDTPQTVLRAMVQC